MPNASDQNDLGTFTVNITTTPTTIFMFTVPVGLLKIRFVTSLAIASEDLTFQLAIGPIGTPIANTARFVTINNSRRQSLGLITVANIAAGETIQVVAQTASSSTNVTFYQHYLTYFQVA